MRPAFLSVEEITYRAKILNFDKPNELRFFLCQLLFLIEPSPDLCPYVSGKGKRLGNSSFLNGGCSKSAQTKFSPHLYVAPMGVSAEKTLTP